MLNLYFLLVFLIFQCHSIVALTDDFDEIDASCFPENFIFGTASGSYQIEGAWNVSGKGENIWDRITHTNPDFIADRRNGDIACDSYHLYKEDVKNIKYIGFKMYRFSLSWSRLFPSGYTTFVNQDGVRYYSALIDELLSNGIEPMITLYHWDLPQPLQDIGGWLNPQIAEIFADFARASFNLFGDKVKWWVTINEPQSVTYGYGDTRQAPALNLNGIGEYQSAHNILRAHGKAYRVYDREFRSKQKGKLSIVLNGDFSYPKNASDPLHVQAAERANQFVNGWYAHPIYTETGDYPPVMREFIDRNSKAEGRNTSRLPYFTRQEIEEIKGSFDYMGLNHYSTKLVEPGIMGADPSFDRDRNVLVSSVPNAPRSACDWLQVVPEGLRDYLKWMKKTYSDPEIFITETGYCDTDNLNDHGRIFYYKEYLKNVLAGIKEDGLKILGYLAWSFMDNFEWRDGYTKNFGLMRVDFDSPHRNRTMKQSAFYFKNFLNNNQHTEVE